MADWNIPGILGTPEYFAYSTVVPGENVTSPALNSWQVLNMTSSNYNHFGLSNSYNAKLFYFNYKESNPTKESKFNQYI